MKRITLLFLALSSLALAGVEVKPGPNFDNTNTNKASSATINVTVSATVTGAPDLVITDLNGNPISEVTFNHVLTPGDVNTQVDQSLTANLRIQGDALSSITTTGFSTKFGTNTLELKNDTSTLTSTLLAETGTIANKEAPLIVKSSLSGEAIDGNYSAQQTRLTVLYEKTAK